LNATAGKLRADNTRLMASDASKDARIAKLEADMQLALRTVGHMISPPNSPPVMPPPPSLLSPPPPPTAFEHVGGGFCLGGSSREPMCAPMESFYLAGTFTLNALQQRCRERPGCRAVSYFPLPNAHYTTNDGYLHFDSASNADRFNLPGTPCYKTPSDMETHSCDCAGATEYAGNGGSGSTTRAEPSGPIDSSDGHPGWQCYRVVLQ